jgi:hypothetical protein
VREDVVFGRAFADEPQCIAGGEHRHVEPAEQIRDRADVVLVAVRDDQTRDAVIGERFEVGMNDVDTEASVVEGHPAIDDEHLAALLEREAIHANLAQAAEGE